MTVAQYQRDVGDFSHALRKWHPNTPILMGIDVNEVIEWVDDNSDVYPVRNNSKMGAFLERKHSRACTCEQSPLSGLTVCWPRTILETDNVKDVILT